MCRRTSTHTHNTRLCHARLCHRVRQPGVLYFLALMNIQIFGVAIEGLKRQVNFLFDEGHCIGIDGKQSHGPDTVISLIHNVLSQPQFLVPKLNVHAFNCAGILNNHLLLILYLHFDCFTLELFQKEIGGEWVRDWNNFYTPPLEIHWYSLPLIQI